MAIEVRSHDQSPPGFKGKTSDVFPVTMRTWIHEQNELGPEGRKSINRHIMEVYAFPLRVYFLGTSVRNLGEPDEIVNGFFAGRLNRDAFINDWIASGMRLRRWLINAFCFHLREVQNKIIRRQGGKTLDDAPLVVEGEAERAFDHAYVVSLVRRAMADAHAECADRRLEKHWEVFVQHKVHSQSYAEVARIAGVTAGRCAVMNRTAETIFKKALRSLLQRDGIPFTELDDEIRRLLEGADR